MKDCGPEAKLSSEIPEHARNGHGNLPEQNRPVAMPVTELARRKACLSCHGVDNRVVGPAFREVARRYRGQQGVEAKLVEKLRRGGGGAWGPLAMPPNPDLAAADATALVRWVLGL